jgi:glycosyltransferase involved in cell wall biosynthesis
MEGEIVDLRKSPAEHLPHLCSGAEALVCTSLYEGFGMPIVEAMRAGTLVLTSNNSSRPRSG